MLASILEQRDVILHTADINEPVCVKQRKSRYVASRACEISEKLRSNTFARLPGNSLDDHDACYSTHVYVNWLMQLSSVPSFPLARVYVSSMALSARTGKLFISMAISRYLSQLQICGIVNATKNTYCHVISVYSFHDSNVNAVEPCNTTGHSKVCRSIAARVSQQPTRRQSSTQRIFIAKLGLDQLHQASVVFFDKCNT